MWDGALAQHISKPFPQSRSEKQASERDCECPHPLPLLSLQPPFLGEGSLQCADTDYGHLTGVCCRDGCVNTGVESTSLP